MMRSILFVGAGSFLDGISRYLLSLAVQPRAADASSEPPRGSYELNYHITDHPGSVRVVFRDKNNVLARNDY